MSTKKVEKVENIEQKDIKKKKKFSPSIFAILIMLSAVVVVVSWIVYWAMGADPYGTVHPAGLLEVISAPIQGFIKGADVIFFLLCLSAFLYIVNQSKALDAGIGRLFLKLKGKETLLIVVLIIVFAVCGTTFGMCEATIPFYFMLLPILYAAGFDGMLAIIVICFGAGAGVFASVINPVLIANAVSSANLGAGETIVGTMDGVVWRLVTFVVITGFVLGYALWYAKRVKKDITKSFVYESIAVESKKFQFDEKAIPALTGKRKAVLSVFVITFIILILFAVPWDIMTGMTGFDYIGQMLATWFPYLAGQTIDPATGQIISNINPVGTWSIYEMGFLFLSASIVAYAINWQGEKELSNQFIKGSSEFVGVAFIVAIATGFSVLLGETGIADILVGALGSMYSGMSEFLSILITLFLFIAIAFFIPSMSGFARAVFPIVGPAIYVAVQAGSAMTVSSAIAVFSFASGWINLAMPTALALIIGLQITGIKLSTFYKKCWVLYVGILLIAVVLCISGIGVNMIAPGIF